MSCLTSPPICKMAFAGEDDELERVLEEQINKICDEMDIRTSAIETTAKSL